MLGQSTSPFEGQVQWTLFGSMLFGFHTYINWTNGQVLRDDTLPVALREHCSDREEEVGDWASAPAPISSSALEQLAEAGQECQPRL